MIFDGENIFMKDKSLKDEKKFASDIIAVGEGEASEPMWLVMFGKNLEGDGKNTLVLETAANKEFSAPETLGTYTKTPLHTKLPRGNKGFLRLSVESTYTGGTLTAGLVLDDDVMK